MIRLGIVSDSHGAEHWLNAYLALCGKEKYDAVYHLGDFCADARWLEKRLEIPVISVAGNCDLFASQPRMARAEYEGHTLVAVHGHLQQVKYGYTTLSYYAEDQGAEIALFGHTHRQYVSHLGRTLLINPGALQNGCYAELLLDGSRVVPLEKNLAD